MLKSGRFADKEPIMSGFLVRTKKNRFEQEAVTRGLNMLHSRGSREGFWDNSWCEAAPRKKSKDPKMGRMWDL